LYSYERCRMIWDADKLRYSGSMSKSNLVLSAQIWVSFTETVGPILETYSRKCSGSSSFRIGTSPRFFCSQLIRRGYYVAHMPRRIHFCQESGKTHMQFRSPYMILSCAKHLSPYVPYTRIRSKRMRSSGFA